MTDFLTPLVIRLETTYVCNHHCPYCYKEEFIKKKGLYYKEKGEKLKRIIDILSKWNVFDITFTGGEPLAEKKVLKNVIIYLRNTTNIDFSINSNLSLMDNDTAAFLKANTIAGMFVSFMSHHEEKFNTIAGGNNNYARTLKGFEYLTKHNIKTTANMVVMKSPINNIDDVYDTAKFLCERFQIHKFSMSPLSPSGTQHNDYIVSNNEALHLLDQIIAIEKDFNIEISLSRPIPLCFTSDLDEKYRKYDFYKGCTIGLANSMTLNADGDVKPCPVWENVVGNVFTDSLEQIKSRLSEYDGTNAGNLKKILPSDCVNCNIAVSCKGGCKTEAIALTGKVDGKCRYYKPHNNNLTQNIFIQYDLLDQELEFKDRVRVRNDGDNLYVIRGERFALLNKAEYSLFSFLFNKRKFILSKELDLNGYDTGRLNLFMNKLMSALVFKNTKEVRKMKNSLFS
ncbi:MAG: radical SAM protein [Candidatus Kuenenia sp.]|nr:radical SAM protein [Candidatus Kuenenia hertensis]